MDELAIAERELLACCASPVWAAEVAGSYPDADALRLAAGTALAELDWPEVEKALAAHPRIGERATGQGPEAAWSRQEQAMADGDEAELARANAEYERTFDRVFLIHATGRTTDQILANLRARLGNDEETERGVIREQLARIVDLRIRKWLA